jgi:ParB-like chromosome segregation protein Spo0J
LDEDRRLVESLRMAPSDRRLAADERKRLVSLAIQHGVLPPQLQKTPRQIADLEETVALDDDMPAVPVDDSFQPDGDDVRDVDTDPPSTGDLSDLATSLDVSVEAPQLDLAEVRVDLCRASPTARPVDANKVRELALSIAEIGLRQPINVRPLPDGSYEVGGGNHRVAAFKLLCRKTIPAIVRAQDSDLIAGMAVIDENLIRNELSPAERAAAVVHRKALYELLHPETLPTSEGGEGRHKQTRRQFGDESVPERFTKATSIATGASERTVQREAERGEKIGEETLGKIAHTSLDKGEELDALIKLPAPAKDELVERAARGETVSAKAVLEQNRPNQKGKTRGAREAGRAPPAGGATAHLPLVRIPTREGLCVVESDDGSRWIARLTPDGWAPEVVILVLVGREGHPSLPPNSAPRRNEGRPHPKPATKRRTWAGSKTRKAAPHRVPDSLSACVVLTPYSRDWWAVLIRRAAKGQPIRQMIDMGRDGKGWTISQRERPSEFELDDLESVEPHGEAFRVANDAFRQRTGTSLPKPAVPSLIYLPRVVD